MFSGTGWPSCRRTSYGCKSRTHWHAKKQLLSIDTKWPNLPWKVAVSEMMDKKTLEKRSPKKSFFFAGQLFWWYDDLIVLFFLYCLHYFTVHFFVVGCLMIWWFDCIVFWCFLYCLHKPYCTWVISRAVHELLLPGTGKTYLMVWQASWKRSDLDAKRYSSNPNPRRSMYGIIDLRECLVYMVNVDKLYQSLCK